MPLNLLGPQETRERDRCFQGNVPVFITLDAANTYLGNTPITEIGQFLADQNYFIPWAMLSLTLQYQDAAFNELNWMNISLAKDPSDGSDYIGIPNQPAYKLPIAKIQAGVIPQTLSGGVWAGTAEKNETFDFKPYGFYLNKGETMRLFVSGTAGGGGNYYAIAQFIAIPTFT